MKKITVTDRRSDLNGNHQIQTCPSCNRDTAEEDFTNYKGDWICEGCAENRDMFENFDDPHGKDWNP